MLNWYAGWGMILAAFLSGAVLGVFFYRDDFLGGYAAFPRRIARLGHIALAALGMLNVIHSLSPVAAQSSTRALIASGGLIVGGVCMPAVCFLAAWRPALRRWFFLPVIALVVAVVQILIMGPP
jgi:hypothetical protein